MKVVLTVSAPEAAIADASHMAVFHGWLQGQTPEEWEGAFSSQWQDAEGNLYRVFSLPVSQAVAEAMLGLMQLATLERPPQDTENRLNMAAVNRAHDMLRNNVWQAGSDEPAPQAAPDKIVAVLGLAGLDAVATMGLASVGQGLS
jgi:NADH:ubiquinone oxidoreductase subunit K